MKSKFKWILSAFLVFSVNCSSFSYGNGREELVWKKSEKKKKFGKKKGKKPVKITVKSLKKDSGPGLEASNKRDLGPFFLYRLQTKGD